MYVFGNVYMSVGTHKGWKRVSGSLELESQVIVSQWIWELETKHRFSRTVLSLDSWAVSPDSDLFILIKC